MNFNNHSKIKGLHAPFSASQPYWLGESIEEMKVRYVARWVPTVGTVTHAFAESMINQQMKVTKADKKMYKLYLLDNKETCIPRCVVDNLDLDYLFSNVMVYINDAIGFKLTAEQILFYSDSFFGTADAISFKNNFLRIHDLKTGRGRVKIEQLEVYAALFCLEYKVKPGSIDIELRIYQNGEIIVHNPTAEDILPIMDQITAANKAFEKFTNKEG